MDKKGPASWKELEFWKTGEWQVVEERLDTLKTKGIAYNPERKNLFKALDICPLDKVKVVFVGQDPYPDGKFATGLAFSIPKETKVTFSNFPPTLLNIFEEYEKDLHYSIPTSGDLSHWSKEGVLLWNAYPSCEFGRSLSHEWTEWSYLTIEILKVLSDRGIVFVFFGGKAREFSKFVTGKSKVIELSHPSPRASKASKNPFLGSRVFTTVNAKLHELKVPAIDWRL